MIENRFVKGISYDKKRYVLPLHHPSEWSSKDIKEFFENGEMLFPLPEEWLPFCKDLGTIDFREEDQDDLFSLTRMRAYPGRDMSRKRNLVSQFKERYNLSARTILDPKEALDMLQRWHYKDGSDQEECAEAIGLLKELDLTSRIYFVSNQPIGFVIGEYLNPSCFVLHFAKADIAYKGVYATIYQEFAQTLPDTVRFLNFEQDLGNPSLRQAKHSFHPDSYLRKMRVLHCPKSSSSIQ